MLKLPFQVAYRLVRPVLKVSVIFMSSLERSNVDITEELVTSYRTAEPASAKAIETTTGLTQTIINIRMCRQVSTD